MNVKNDGGPAFPTDMGGFSQGGAEVTIRHLGMTLRDYFAGQAMVGDLAGMPPESAVHDEHEFADWWYKLADAMLLARLPVEEAAEHL